MVPLYRKLNLLIVRTPGAGSNTMKIHMRKFEEPHWLKVRNGITNPQVLEWEKIRHKAHLTARQIRALWPDEFASYKVVGVVRHPVDWTNSIWRKGGIETALQEDTSGSYSDYLKRLELTPYKWLTDADGSVIVDEIWRTEDMFEIFKSLGIPGPFKAENVSTNNKAIPTRDDMEILKTKFHREWTHY